MNRIRVVIADDHHVMRQSLAEYLQRYPDILLVGEIAKTEQLFGVLESTEPEVLLLGANLLGPQIFKMSQKVTKQFPNTHILVTSAYPRYDYIVSLLKSGVFGCILRNDTIDEMLHGIRATASQDEWVSSHSLGILIESVTGRSLNDLKLTVRELEVLTMIAAGRKNREIAQDLVISVQTVKNHTRNIYNKLGVGSRVEAVTYALDQGLISLPSSGN